MASGLPPAFFPVFRRVHRTRYEGGDLLSCPTGGKFCGKPGPGNQSRPIEQPGLDCRPVQRVLSLCHELDPVCSSPCRSNRLPSRSTSALR